MTRRLPRLGAAALATALLLTLPACGGDSDGGSDDGGTSSGPAADDSGSDPAEPSEDAGDDTGGDAPAGGVTFVDVTEGATVVTIGPDGFDPDELTVAVGDVVQFTAGDDGLYSVIVNDLDGYTVGSGIDEYFSFDQPGTYPVTEDLSQATATITAE